MNIYFYRLKTIQLNLVDEKENPKSISLILQVGYIFLKINQMGMGLRVFLVSTSNEAVTRNRSGKSKGTITLSASYICLYPFLSFFFAFIIYLLIIVSYRL